MPTLLPTLEPTEVPTYIPTETPTEGPTEILTEDELLQKAIFINAGGSNFTDPDGNSWISDTDFVDQGAKKFSTTHDIKRTNKQTIYQTERNKFEMTCKISALNGDYSISMHFAEIFSGALNVGARLFDIFVESDLVSEDLDIYNEAGRKGFKACVMNVTDVRVRDEELTIKFLGVNQYAKVSGIEIHPVAIFTSESTSMPTLAPTLEPTGEPSFGVDGFILVDADKDEDIDGALDCKPVSRCFGSASSFNIRATVFGENVESVTISIDGPVAAARKEAFAPFAVFGDYDGDYHGMDLTPGAYVVTAYAVNHQGEASQNFTKAFGVALTQTPKPTPRPTPRPTLSPSSPFVKSQNIQKSIFINAGGPSFTDSDGNRWVADMGYYDDGRKYSTKKSITDTEKPMLYQTERNELEMTYSIDLSNGSYQVLLHFAEIFLVRLK